MCLNNLNKIPFKINCSTWEQNYWKIRPKKSLKIVKINKKRMKVQLFIETPLNQGHKGQKDRREINKCLRFLLPLQISDQINFPHLDKQDKQRMLHILVLHRNHLNPKIKNKVQYSSKIKIRLITITLNPYQFTLW